MNGRRLAVLAADPAAHFARIALQGGFHQVASGYLWYQLDHVFADTLMFAAPGIAEANDFNRLFLFKNNVLAAVTGCVYPFRPEHQRGGLRAASGEEDKGNEAFHLGRMWVFG